MLVAPSPDAGSIRAPISSLNGSAKVTLSPGRTSGRPFSVSVYCRRAGGASDSGSGAFSFSDRPLVSTCTRPWMSSSALASPSRGMGRPGPICSLPSRMGHPAGPLRLGDHRVLELTQQAKAGPESWSLDLRRVAGRGSRQWVHLDCVAELPELQETPCHLRRTGQRIGTGVGRSGQSLRERIVDPLARLDRGLKAARAHAPAEPGHDQPRHSRRRIGRARQAVDRVGQAGEAGEVSERSAGVAPIKIEVDKQRRPRFCVPHLMQRLVVAVGDALDVEAVGAAFQPGGGCPISA